MNEIHQIKNKFYLKTIQRTNTVQRAENISLYMKNINETKQVTTKCIFLIQYGIVATPKCNHTNQNIKSLTIHKNNALRSKLSEFLRNIETKT